jgi:integrase/recombinase XerC
MRRARAKVLQPEDEKRLIKRTKLTRNPDRDTVIVLLSFKAGMRACEIAGLTWSMVLQTDGQIAEHISISNGIAKYGRDRLIPMHSDLRKALVRHHRGSSRRITGPVIASERGGHMTPRSVVNWFRSIYTDLAFTGCSSHSGRRTFITRSAKMISKVGGSLRDIQELAGHRALTTTERYIEGDRDAQRKLIRLL